jgi:hypothetical protein
VADEQEVKLTFDHVRTYLLMVEAVAKGEAVGAAEVRALPREDWKVTINSLLRHRQLASEWQHVKAWATADLTVVS